MKKWEDIFPAVDKLKVIASELECTVSQLAIAWVYKNQNVSTIILGASSVAQLQENLKSIEVAKKLTDEIMTRIDEATGTKPTPVPEFRKR